ncbi:MAG: hypothetical protein ACREVI_09320 [Steroidobacteraceae bacterium]
MRAAATCGCAAATMLCLLLPLAAGAQEAPQEAPQDAPQDAQPTPDPCRDAVRSTAEGLDAMRAGLQRSVCSTARFVDRMFGGEHEYAETEDESNGRASVTLGWNEQDDFKVGTRFRVSVNLPALHERLNATIGRAERDEYVADETTADPVIGDFSDDEEAEWFAGLGYRVLRRRDSRFDLGAGVKLQSPLNPYANARYRHYVHFNPNLLLTLRTTAFVENDEGFGVTQAFDFDRVVSPDYLLRFGNSVRMSEETDGVRWRSRVALYQAIDYKRAMRYEVKVRGETDGTQPDLYGASVTHRRSFLRDWLFVEFGGELFWADGPLPSDRCDACLGASIGFEVLFGEAYDRVLRQEESAQESIEHPQ